MDAHTLSSLYRGAHDRMRDVDGLHPQEAFDELLKFLFIKEYLETKDHPSVAATPSAWRRLFSHHIKHLDPWARQFWQDGQLRLCDQTLSHLQRMFIEVQLGGLPLDVRSTALRTFLTPDIRKGLGIFLTPEDVVRAMVEIAAPAPDETVLDPACGSGTFLLETVRFNKRATVPTTVYGVEKNPRMLLLADLNLGDRNDVCFRRACIDSLRELGRSGDPVLGLRPSSVDLILTNPPFGVTVTRDTGTLDLFNSGPPSEDRVPSEVLFLRLCLRLLRPGGRLGIVLPRSVITNDGLAKERRQIDQLGRLTDLIDLPAETFATMGTQTTTVAAFFRRHDRDEPKTTTVRTCLVTNVGVDTTGRTRKGSQLPSLAQRLSGHRCIEAPRVTTHHDISTSQTLQQAAKMLFRRSGRTGCHTLREFVELANTGRTPARKAYTQTGTFILKVGNLTGRGIDWAPRERNFVSVAEGKRRATSNSLFLQTGDILLTASAHAAKYIAKKVDVIADVPKNILLTGGVTFVGEIIRVRPLPDVDPFVLLAALRHPDVREDIQVSVRGQTAHLHPTDMLAVSVPWNLRSPKDDVLAIAKLLREEARIAIQLHEVSSGIATRFHHLTPR